MKKGIILLLCGCLPPAAATLHAQWVTHHNAVAEPSLPKPAVNATFTDPKFGTRVTRLTNAKAAGIPGIYPDYAKRQAWNADDTRLLLRNGYGSFSLYDGNSYQYLETLDNIYGEDVFWHPANPDLLYFVPDSILYSYNVKTRQTTTLHVFTAFTWTNTRGEGNLSADGRYYAFAGQRYNYNTGETTFDRLQLYDFQTDKILSDKALPRDSLDGFDWVSVSPSGNYVVVDYANEVTGRYHGVEVYDRNFNLVWQKPLGAGHSDLGRDASGEDVLVMDIYDANLNKTLFRKFRLRDGFETTLLEISPLFDQHISCRNLKRNEWCFVSTFDFTGRLRHDSLSFLPFEDEVFALRLDGSGDVQRIAHHHSRRYSPVTPNSDHSVYFAEPHATVDRNGTRVLWGSNWNQNVADEQSVDAYIADFTSLVSTVREPQDLGMTCSLYPNPGGDYLSVHLEFASATPFRLELLDATGRMVFSQPGPDLPVIHYEASIPTQSLPQGLYVLHISTPGKNIARQCQIMH